LTTHTHTNIINPSVHHFYATHIPMNFPGK
jgi:hypothetical protein